MSEGLADAIALLLKDRKPDAFGESLGPRGEQKKNFDLIREWFRRMRREELSWYRFAQSEDEQNSSGTVRNEEQLMGREIKWEPNLPSFVHSRRGV